MPINIPTHLPAKQVLESEHIFVMDESRAFHQDIHAKNYYIKFDAEKNPNRDSASQIAWKFAFTGSFHIFNPKHTHAEKYCERTP